MIAWFYPLALVALAAVLLWRPIRDERRERHAKREMNQRQARVEKLPLRSEVVDGETTPSRSLARLLDERPHGGNDRTVR